MIQPTGAGEVTQQIPRGVLVIEDDPDYRNLLQRFLNKAFPDAGVELYDPEANGRPGPEFDWSRFDVLLLDYRLGEKENGLDWLREYKKKDSKFPATILLTGAGSEEVAVRALRFGAHDYLNKQKLNAKRLTESIADAFNMRAEEESISRSLTINASRFSKTYFYGQFDLAFEEAEKGEQRAVLLIKTDGFEALQKSLGVLVTDELARFLANMGIEVSKNKRYHPRATRFTDSSIALLVGGYDDRRGLEILLGTICKRIAESPPRINDSQVPITVSIGAAPIVSRQSGVDGLLEQAGTAASEAEDVEGNSFVIASSDSSRRRMAEARHAGGDRFDAKSAMKENRIQAMFLPITLVSEGSAELEVEEFFQVNPRFISLSGDSLPADPVLAEHSDQVLFRLVDRWKLRECVGRLLAGSAAEQSPPGFLVGLSEISYLDVNLARWIGELVKFYGKPKQFKEIFLSVPPDVLMRKTRPVVTLLEHLRKQHGFKFALESIEDPALCKLCFSSFKFDMVILTEQLVENLIRKGPELDEFQKLDKVKNGALLLARGIADANGLHAVISAGIDLVQGDFVAPEQEEIDAVAGIESVQIGD